MSNPIVIGLCGLQQSGKSSAAQSLVDHWDFHRVSFAGTLYRMMAALLDVHEDILRAMDKNAPQAALCGKSIRQGLQLLGTEWGRDMIGKNIWTENARLTIDRHLRAGHHVVVDDCRFLNEYEMLRLIGAKIVMIERADAPEQSANHGSEVEWKKFTPHCRIENVAKTPTEWHGIAGTSILQKLSSIGELTEARSGLIIR